LQALNWRSLNNTLATLTEDQVLSLMNEERIGKKRASMLTRLHQRYSSLRASRERIEILAEAKQP
jgi:hypothetical protein